MMIASCYTATQVAQRYQALRACMPYALGASDVVDVKRLCPCVVMTLDSHLAIGSRCAGHTEHAWAGVHSENAALR